MKVGDEVKIIGQKFSDSNYRNTIGQACGNIPNVEAKSQCEMEFKRSANFRDCVERYGINDNN